MRVHANTSSSDVHWKKQPNRLAHLELCYRNLGILERVLNRIVLCNSIRGKWMPTQVKTTRTWENFNNREAKTILLSEKLLLIANNSKNFVNGSKSIIRNNLGLCKRSEIYFIWNFQKNRHGSNGLRIWIGKLIIFGSDRKKMVESLRSAEKGHA